MGHEYLATKSGLYKNGKKVKLEFGNAAQIKAIRDYEKNSGALDTDLGLMIEPEWKCKAEGHFVCTCGRGVYYEFDADSNGDVDPFVGETANCHGCGNNYQFSVNESDEIFVKRYFKTEEE